MNSACPSYDRAITVRAFALVFGWSVMLTVLMTCSSGQLLRWFGHNYPYFYDPAAYYAYNMTLLQSCERVGSVQAAFADLQTNVRDPIRTFPIVLFAPQLLNNPLGHMITSVPLLFIYLFVLGTCTYKRSRSILYAVTSMSIIFAANHIFDPMIGFAPFWLDLPAALAMTASALCLVQFSVGCKKRWLFWFGCLATVTATARFSAAFYLFFYAAPILPWLLYKNYKRKCSFVEGVVLPISCVIVGALPGICFVLRSLATMASYYKVYGYAFGATVSSALSWTAFATYKFSGGVFFSVCVILILMSWLSRSQRRGVAAWLEQLLVTAWLPISIVVFLCFVVRAIDGMHPVLYMVPAFIAFATNSKQIRMNLPRVLVCLAILILVTLTACSDIRNYRSTYSSVPFYFSVQKAVDLKLADLIVESRATSFVEFDRETINPSLEAFFLHKWFCNSMTKYFSVHPAYFKGWYPGLDAEQVARHVYAGCVAHIQLVAVMHKVSDIRKNIILEKSYCSTVSRYMTERVLTSSNWRYVASVNTGNGLLDVYENKDLVGVTEKSFRD